MEDERTRGVFGCICQFVENHEQQRCWQLCQMGHLVLREVNQNVATELFKLPNVFEDSPHEILGFGDCIS